MALNLIQNAGIIKNYEDQFQKDPAHPLQDVSPPKLPPNPLSVVKMNHLKKKQ